MACPAPGSNPTPRVRERPLSGAGQACGAPAPQLPRAGEETGAQAAGLSPRASCSSATAASQSAGLSGPQAGALADTGPGSGGARLCPPPGSRAQVAAVVASGPWAAAPAHTLNLTGSLPPQPPALLGTSLQPLMFREGWDRGPWANQVSQCPAERVTPAYGT